MYLGIKYFKKTQIGIFCFNAIEPKIQLFNNLTDLKRDFNDSLSTNIFDALNDI